MTIKIPGYIKLVIKTLEEKGYEAYVVGGAIRDSLLNRNPLDFDISSNALPGEIEDIFFKCKPIPLGKNFGTMVLPMEEANVEITTFRIEGDYKDGRKPDWVSFSTNIIDDLSRRDFTINAMAYNEERGLIDPFNGQGDLERKIIRTVGDPGQRFGEDYLRILRAVRFASQLGFDIEEATFNKGKKYAKNIYKISQERIREELFKILLSEIPSQGIKLLKEIGILDLVLPELMATVGFDQKNPYHDKDLFTHSLCVLDHVDPILNLRLAALFHDLGKPSSQVIDSEGIGRYHGHDRLGGQMTKEILKRLRVSNGLIDRTEALVNNHMNHHNDFSEKGLKRLIRRIGEEEIFNLLNLQKADIKCSKHQADISHIIDREKKIKEILEKNEAVAINQLNINGHDLIKLGFPEGKIIGDILEYLLERVMEDPELNQKDKLEKITKSFLAGD